MREPSSLSCHCLIVETMIRLVLAYSDRRIKRPRALFDTISVHDIAESFRRGENTGAIARIIWKTRDDDDDGWQWDRVIVIAITGGARPVDILLAIWRSADSMRLIR